MQELFRKYLDNQCSPEDVKELLSYFSHPANETVLRGLIADSLEDTDSQTDAGQWQVATDDLLVHLKKGIDTEKGRVIPLYKKKWPRIAAAVILLAGGLYIYKYSSQPGIQKPQIAETNSGNQISPGFNKAILTLNDGSTINLETASKGELNKQGNTSLIKETDGHLTYKSLNEKPTQILYNSIATPRGGQYQLALSDGTIIWLNAASSIHYPVSFSGSERVVDITGEAYFEVSKNPAMPFKVKIAGKAEVEVLGTHFDIDSYSDESSINTTLLEGSVKVTSLVQNDSKIIVPGEQAQLNSADKIRVVKPSNVEQIISWKDGTFNFDDSSLETVLRQLARWYDVDIVFEGAIPQKKFTGEIQRTLSISQVLKLLEKNGVKGRLEGNKLIISN